VLVHCGAGVSRSATLAMAYLMRAQRVSAAKARAQVAALRSCVCINDGFWRTLCALEAPLGLSDRWAAAARAPTPAALLLLHVWLLAAAAAAGRRCQALFCLILDLPRWQVRSSLAARLIDDHRHRRRTQKRDGL
jgi:hypothetical protein